MSDCNAETERQCYALKVPLQLLNLNGALIMNSSTDKNELYYAFIAIAAAALFIWMAIDASEVQLIWAIICHS
ncbi:hypothetical protein CW309_16450 [Pseudomonas hunanensis]|uniref:Uncharacterized protein n=1 Tax=Pseudomonas hunanensis TaxID=1247546 RepID=A0ACC9N000_9PSED|nr:hypothetical protein CW309_16450 [Pseudomonas hunanensis]